MKQEQVAIKASHADAAGSIVKRMKDDTHLVLSASEIDVLLNPELPIATRKYGVLGLFKAERHAEAAPLAKLIADQDPTEENLKNLWTLLLKINDLPGLEEIAEKARGIVDPIDYHSLMVNTCMYLNRPADAVRHGDLCLEARDRRFAPKSVTRPWTIPQFNRNAITRNVIAFSVFGANERYLKGAENNSIAARYVYPNWISRFYVDETVPLSTRNILQANGAQVIVMKDMPAEKFGTQWRFLVEDDPGVDFYLVRDADSVVTSKEAFAVAEWLESDKAFHIMRDHFAHTELVLAGMWGARRGNISGMCDRILEYDKSTRIIANNIHKDQHFLREQIWPIMKGSVCIHDSMFNFMNPHRYDPRTELPSHRHIGQNDWVNYKSSRQKV